MSGSSSSQKSTADDTGRTALHAAALQNDLRSVSSLLKENTVDVNQLDAYEQTAVVLAAEKGSTDIVLALCSHEATNLALQVLYNMLIASVQIMPSSSELN
jgi:ankyrin repeat protein